MNHELQPGDRVKVIRVKKRSGCHAGDKGTVLWGPNLAGEVTYYIVKMDHSRKNRPLVLTEDAVQLDA